MAPPTRVRPEVKTHQSGPAVGRPTPPAADENRKKNIGRSPNTRAPGNYAPPRPYLSADAAAPWPRDRQRAPLLYEEYTIAAGDGKMLIHHFRRSPSFRRAASNSGPLHSGRTTSSRRGGAPFCRSDQCLPATRRHSAF